MNRIYHRPLAWLLPVAWVLSACGIAPKPLEPREIEQRAEADVQRLFAEQEPVDGVLTLYDAMARAIRYNLDQRVKLREQALARGQSDIALFDLLPTVSATGTLSNRSEYSATTSVSIYTNTESLELSKSQEKTRTTGNIAFYWNLLDFGVSYFQAKQLADQFLIVQEQRRKAVQDIIRDVRYAYWQAMAAQALADRTDGLLSRARAALRDSRKLERQRLHGPEKAMNFQKELLEHIHRLLAMRKQLDLAQYHLAALINLKPGSAFRLDQSLRYRQAVPKLDIDMEKLVRHALAHRSELREEDYQERIGVQEVRKALLRMFPGVELAASRQHDSNKFLYWNAWTDSSLQASFDLFNALSTPKAIANAEAQTELARTRRLSMAMAVMTQVHLAMRQYHHIKEEYEVTRQLREINKRRSQHTKAAKKASKAEPLEVIRSEMSALLAEVQRDLTYAELQNTVGMLYHSIGFDPLPPDMVGGDLKTLAAALRHYWHPLPKLTLPAETGDDEKKAPAVVKKESKARTARVEKPATPPLKIETGDASRKKRDALVKIGNAS